MGSFCDEQTVTNRTVYVARVTPDCAVIKIDFPADEDEEQITGRYRKLILGASCCSFVALYRVLKDISVQFSLKTIVEYTTCDQNFLLPV